LRDARGGRSFESYGEDPFVNGKMGAADCGDAQRAASW